MSRSTEGAPVHSVGSSGDAELPSNWNISDVLEAITIADPSYQTDPIGEAMHPRTNEAAQAPPAQQAAPAHEPRPYIRILEQPASKALRFRYECEGRSAGSIPGANSSPEKKTFPTIEICGHRGRAIVVVSCVTKDHYLPHPHNLVGRENCSNGVCTVNVTPDSSVVTFSNLGIQCVKRRDIEEALTLRESMRVDPFKKGFTHKSQPQAIDLNAVRLCFQAFLPDRNNRIRHALPPVVSDVIYDKKAMSDLVITRLSHCSAPVIGGKEVILLCEKVAREDIAVTFFEKVGDQICWHADAGDVYVHKQVAICFKTPRYRDINTTEHVQAWIQLRRPSDNATSEPVAFELIPIASDLPHGKKRPKMSPDYSDFLQAPDRNMNQQIPDYLRDMMGLGTKPIKLEPRDRTPPHAMQSPPPIPNIYTSPSAIQEAQTVDPQSYRWNMDMVDMHALAVPGPSHTSPYHQETGWTPNIQHLSPAVSPMNPCMSPTNMEHISPNMGHMSPNMGHHSPLGHISPNMGHISPNMGHMSPNMGHISPNMTQMATNMIQPQALPQLPHDSIMETGTSDPPSITGLLIDRGDQIPQLNSSELSGLSSLLADSERPETLSDSLNRLSTGDLLPREHNMT